MVIIWLFMKILFTGSETASDVAFGLVVVQHLLDFGGKPRVDLMEPFGDVFVDGGFGDSKMGRSTPHRRTGFHDVAGEFKYSLLDVILHSIDSSPPLIY